MHYINETQRRLTNLEAWFAINFMFSLILRLKGLFLCIVSLHMYILASPLRSIGLLFFMLLSLYSFNVFATNNKKDRCIWHQKPSVCLFSCGFFLVNLFDFSTTVVSFLRSNFRIYTHIHENMRLGWLVPYFFRQFSIIKNIIDGYMYYFRRFWLYAFIFSKCSLFNSHSTLNSIAIFLSLSFLSRLSWRNIIFYFFVVLS